MERAKIFLFCFLFAAAAPVWAQERVNCPRAEQDPPCKGECGRFVDGNGDGVCDVCGETAPKKAEGVVRKTAAKPVPVEKKLTVKDAASEPAAEKAPVLERTEPGDWEIFYGKLKMFYLIPLLSSLIFMVLISEILKARIPSYLPLHRDIWNWLLFLAFFCCVTTGMLLFFGFFLESRNIFFKLHLWSGFVSSAAGLYHFFERLRCMPPFKKCR